ncbi:hypothetical protein GPJ56_008665 [Histomonas meleagridis]|uniref:uncharacterized protein n=1 Tax=Histomonas meleagridis TaxID=135588 RepID=UPI0035594E97|nr:hypothetical protein GPJ56_008665 [Histomonas meleagridis]KAH0805758.1 hypothetical protein GO595_001397 [Histomonas meleagridis]
MRSNSFSLMFDDESIGFAQLQRNEEGVDYGMNLSPESIPEINPMSLEDMSISMFEDDAMLSGWNTLRQEQNLEIRRKKPQKVAVSKETMILRPFESCQATEASVLYLRMWANRMVEKSENQKSEETSSK